MTAELIRDENTFRRHFFYLLHDKDRISHPSYYEILPRHVGITLDREEENAPWDITWIEVRGPRIKIDGTVGVREGSHSYSWRDGKITDPLAPDWLPPLVEETYQLAERERRDGRVTAQLVLPILGART